jgi:holliday junction DNA helicase RuvA
MVGWDGERTIMIGYLRGKVIQKKQTEIWLDVNGVGYRIKTQCSKFEVQNEIDIFIHTAVREDAITLFGFETMKGLEIFELLLTVSGIGPKTAMVIVGTQKVERIEKAIREADVQFFQEVPGIGKKSAQRIIVDLKSKIGSIKELDLQSEDGVDDDVTLALMQFGFKREEIRVAMKEVDGNLTDAEKVKAGLKRLGRK